MTLLLALAVTSCSPNAGPTGPSNTSDSALPSGGNGGPSASVAFTAIVDLGDHSSETVTVELGAWMFKRQQVELDAIADWTLVGGRDQIGGREILEPINVIWVDFVSTDELQARSRVITFLVNRRFTDQAGHGIGYSSFYGSRFSPAWRDQISIGAWSDAPFLFENNHGRVFPAFRTNGNGNRSVYLTTGAFSREGAGTHEYVSFRQARAALLTRPQDADDWRDVGLARLNNAYDTPWFVTGDHDGFAQVFLADNPDITGRWINRLNDGETYQLTQSGRTFSGELQNLVAEGGPQRCTISGSISGNANPYAVDVREDCLHGGAPFSRPWSGTFDASGGRIRGSGVGTSIHGGTFTFEKDLQRP